MGICDLALVAADLGHHEMVLMVKQTKAAAS